MGQTTCSCFCASLRTRSSDVPYIPGSHHPVERKLCSLATFPEHRETAYIVTGRDGITFHGTPISTSVTIVEHRAARPRSRYSTLGFSSFDPNSHNTEAQLMFDQRLGDVRKKSNTRGPTNSTEQS
ncbi:hypothetical protein BDW22DRAFT_162520 [Trametopsis cervina]|nr:hypothetical protein BDW22DRAFT_162520 [Trametopsis cervina]